MHKKVYEANYGFYASPDYLKRFGIPENPEDLVWHRYITHRNRNPDNVLKFRNKKEIKLKPFLSIDDSRTMIECAKQGLGIIKLHSYTVAEALQKKELVEILEGFDDSIQPIYLCYQPRRYIQPKIRHFIDFFCAKFAKKPNTNYQKHL
ncbi:MAG TPA: LysR substrate-binding domain-containing protein [Parachlamydiaceae bacterium]|nr:LysR substrate-binding domain-containing protein [Parachlamydiaceae bacterium]